MITLKCSHNPKALGDVIDCIFLGHVISKIEGVRVNVQIKHVEQAILNEIIRFGDVIIGKETIKAINKELKNQILYFVILGLLSY